MTHSETEPPAGAHGGHPGWLYATRADFSVVSENDFEPLYRLAFLLTANHEDAERCFAAAIEDVFENSAVLKDRTRSWIKRSLIKNAIRIVFSEPDRHMRLIEIRDHDLPGSVEFLSLFRIRERRDRDSLTAVEADEGGIH